jgi:hypothetical protein
MTNLVTLNTTSALPRPIWVPKCYLAVHRTQVCACCRHKAEWTEVFAKADGETAWRLAAKPILLQRVRTLDWDVPLEQVEGRRETIPFCTHCHQPQVDPNRNLPRPIQHEPRTQIIGLHRPEAIDAPPPKAKPSAPTARRSAATLDDLLDMM